MKKLSKYIAVCVAVLFILSVIAFTFISNNSGNRGDIKFEVIKEGFISGFAEEKMIVIDNNDDYQKMMAVVYANLDQMPIVPEVDFDKYTIITAALGTRNTGGFTINIDKISNSKRKVTVKLTEYSPGANCVVNDMVTSPYQVIKVKKITKEIKFNISKKIQDCQ